MRIQILPLPAVVIGDVVDEPFALVVDQCESGLLNTRDDEVWKQFRDDLGARACLVVPYTVEIVDRYADPQPPPVAFNIDSTVATSKQPVTDWQRTALKDGEPPLGWSRLAKSKPVPGEPDELAALPVEVRQLVHAVDRMRDQWAEADGARQHELWQAVHEANDRVWGR